MSDTNQFTLADFYELRKALVDMRSDVVRLEQRVFVLERLVTPAPGMIVPPGPEPVK